MDSRQIDAFWQTIRIMDQSTVLPYTMVIGSWAEFIYSFYFNQIICPTLEQEMWIFFTLISENHRIPYNLKAQ